MPSTTILLLGFTAVLAAFAAGGCYNNPNSAGGQSQPTDNPVVNKNIQPLPIGLHPGAGNYGMGTTGTGKNAATTGATLGAGKPSSANNAGGANTGGARPTPQSSSNSPG